MRSTTGLNGLEKAVAAAYIVVIVLLVTVPLVYHREWSKLVMVVVLLAGLLGLIQMMLTAHPAADRNIREQRGSTSLFSRIFRE